MSHSPHERTRPQVGTGSESNGQKLGSTVSPPTPEIRYVVSVDLSSAVDEYGRLDEHEATRLAYGCSGFPAGALVRLHIGAASTGYLPRLGEVLAHAGMVEIIGSDPRGLRHVGDSLSGADPLALQVVR